MTPLNKQIIALRKKGLTFNQIAKQLKCSKSTVSYALRKKTRAEVAKKKVKISKPLTKNKQKSIPLKIQDLPKNQACLVSQ